MLGLPKDRARNRKALPLMPITVEEFWQGLSDGQADTMRKILDGDNKLVLEDILAQYPKSTLGWQVFQKFLESRSTKVTSGQKWLMKAYRTAFAQAGIEFPVKSEAVMEAGADKSKFSDLLARVVTTAEVFDVTLPKRVPSDVSAADAAALAEGDEEPF